MNCHHVKVLQITGILIALVCVAVVPTSFAVVSFFFMQNNEVAASIVTGIMSAMLTFHIFAR